MALSIKNKELEAVSRELARLTGKPITEALLEGARRELARQRHISSYSSRSRNELESAMVFVRGLQNDLANLENPNPMSDDDILGYDEFGVPSR